MNPARIHVIDPDTDVRLRALDASGATSDHDTQRERADHVLASILATDPAAPVGTATPAIPATTARRHPIRWAAAAAATLLVGGGAFAAQTANAPLASASWTAVPSAVSATDLTLAEAACREQSRGSGPDKQWLDADRLSVRLAERRGDWVAVLLTGAGRNPTETPETSVSCLVALAPGGASVGEVQWGASGGGGFDAPTGPEFTEGAMSQFGLGGRWLEDGETVSFVDGRVGSDVAKLTIHSADGKSVDASIKDGTYAAWWPGATFDLSQPLPPSGEGGPEPHLTYDITLQDGTLLTNVTPTRPQS